MGEWKKQFQNEIEDLKQIRDELRVQANLGAKEMRQKVDELEGRWPELEEKIVDLETKSTEAMVNAGRTIATELKKAYQQIKDEIATTDKPSGDDT